MAYECNQERRWHVFVDGQLACQCCLQVEPDLKRCKHRPQAELHERPAPPVGASVVTTKLE